MNEQRYQIDRNWVWGARNRRLRGVATVRATVSNPNPGVATRRVEDWLATIENGEGDHRWGGGWSVSVHSRAATEVELDLTSGGEDVADSLQYAVDELQDAVLDDDTTIDWQPQPIRRG